MYFFSFIYNMLKCQKEEKVFCKTQKYELQLLPAACCFHKNELELFLEDWPRRPPPSPDASGLPPFRHCHLFFYFFSIFCIQHISVSLPATYTHSRQHIPFGFCLLPELYAFIIVSFRSVLILSQVATLSSGVSRPHLTRIILIHPQARTSRSGFSGRIHTTSPISFPVKAISAFHQLSRFLPAQDGRHLTRSILITQKPFHPHPALPASTTPPAPNQLPTLSPDALRHLTMPPGYLLSPPLCHSLPLLQYPIFSFSFFFLLLFSFFFFSFFFSSFFFPFFLFFFFSLFLVCTFFCLFLSYTFLFLFPSTSYITMHVFLCAQSQRLQNRT